MAPTDFHVTPDVLAGLVPHATRIADGVRTATTPAELVRGGGQLATHQALGTCADVWHTKLVELAAEIARAGRQLGDMAGTYQQVDERIAATMRDIEAEL